jgi:hypothetical protein
MSCRSGSFIIAVGALALGMAAWSVRGGERQELRVRRLSPEAPLMESAAEAESPERPDVPRPRESIAEPLPAYRESGWWELDVQGNLIRVDVVPIDLEPAVMLFDLPVLERRSR